MERSTARSRFEQALSVANRALSAAAAKAEVTGDVVAEERLQVMRAELRSMMDASVNGRRHKAIRGQLSL